MMKLDMIFSAFLLGGCAGSVATPESLPVDNHATVAQANVLSDTVPTAARTETVLPESGSEPGSSKSGSEPDLSESNPQLAAADEDIEEVIVEGFKEKEVCTTERRTGTRIATRYCRTITVQMQQREASRAFVNRIKATPMGLDAAHKE